MLSDQEIAEGKRRTAYALPAHHEHDDCIRMAYEWLDAQPKLKSIPTKSTALKHKIEHWAGRYISQSDVEVAAELHPEIFGKYPRYNISLRMVRPSFDRLSGIGEAGKHPNYRNQLERDKYSRSEE